MIFSSIVTSGENDRVSHGYKVATIVLSVSLSISILISIILCAIAGYVKFKKPKNSYKPI